jgi:hypothetical protein
MRFISHPLSMPARFEAGLFAAINRLSATKQIKSQSLACWHIRSTQIREAFFAFVRCLLLYWLDIPPGFFSSTHFYIGIFNIIYPLVLYR